MKKSAFWFALVSLFSLAGVSLAQDMDSIPRQTPKTVKKTNVSHLQQVKNRIADQTKKINDGIQAKIFSAAEGKKYTAALASVRKQLAKYVKKNGKKKDLTKSQQDSLNQMLTENSKAIEGSDSDDEAPAKPSASGE
jgi:hypothetical protein